MIFSEFDGMIEHKNDNESIHHSHALVVGANFLFFFQRICMMFRFPETRACFGSAAFFASHTANPIQ